MRRIERQGDQLILGEVARQFPALANAGFVSGFESDTHVVWIGTMLGLVRWRPSDNTYCALRSIPGVEQSLPHNTVGSLASDLQGNIWVGTWQGIGVIPGGGEAFRVVAIAEAGRPSRVHSIVPDDQGRKWLGLSGGALVRMETDLKLSSPFLEEEIGPFDVLSLSWSNGVLWAATVGGGVLEWDLRRGVNRSTTRHYMHGVPAIDIHADDDRVVVGTANAGLWERSGLGDFQPLDLGGWADSYTWGITPSGHGGFAFSVWSDTVGGVFEWRAGKVSEVVEARQRGPLGTVSNSRILTFLNASDGSLWIGTEGSGVFRVDGEGQVLNIGVDQGLSHSNVQSLLEDASGAIWASTAKGLTRMDPDGAGLRTFTAQGGALDDRFFAGAAWSDSATGKLYFGGASGVTIVDPAALRSASPPPRPIITEILVGSQPIDLDTLAPGVGLRLAPDEDYFAVAFATADFTEPARNRYEYMLEGLHDDWTDAGATPVATYRGVRWGSYTLRVRAMNAAGKWADGELTLPVTIETPWYRTWWAQSLGFALVVGFITALYGYRLAQLKARQALRLRIAGDLHDDIGANLSAMALKAEMVRSAKALTDSKRKQLLDVGRLARETAHKVRETVWVVNTEYDSVAGLVVKMRDSVDTLLDDEVHVEFRAPEDLPQKEIAMELRQDTYLLFKESLQNVIKHANATRIDVDVGYRVPFLTITVRDDGKGFDPNDPDLGNGLKLMQQRAAKHRGTVTHDSTPGEGTTVTIRMRMK